MMNQKEMIPLTLTGITYSQASSGAYALILSEPSDGDGDMTYMKNSGRKLPIIIGSWEAQSIAEAFQNEPKPKRPLTHDLFTIFAASFNVYIEKVVIYRLLDGIFYSMIYAVNQADGRVVELDSRTSDAVALALRFHAPIYTYEDVMDVAGVYFKTKKDNKKNMEDDMNDIPTWDIDDGFIKKTLRPYSDVESDELYALLEKAVQEEDYELAAILRDEIKTRNKQ